MDDLDVCDLEEVRRRVVDPVLTAAEASGELTVVSLGHRAPPGWAGSWADDPPPRAWLALSADNGESRFEHPIGKAMFWRCDADYEAGFLESELGEWICLGTRFGWGTPGAFADYAVPGPNWPDGRVLEVYPDEWVSFPVWERGIRLTADELGLSSGLAADLFSWHQTLDDVSAALDSDPSRLDIGRRFAMEEVTNYTYAQHKRAEAMLQSAGLASWTEYVDLFQSWRDDLVERLRAEVGPDISVATPLRIPIGGDEEW